MTTKDDKVAINFRFDEALHQQLTKAAQQSLRSLNNEILYRVKRSFEQKADEVAAP
jgi:predicted HicB family RNase H-like nuclease